MISLPELKNLIKEMAEDVLAKVPQHQLNLLTDEEVTQLRTLLTKSQIGGLTPSEKDQIMTLKYAVTTRGRESLAGTELDPAIGGAAAERMRATTEPAALKSLGHYTDEPEVDPLADTAVVPSLAKTRKLRSDLSRTQPLSKIRETKRKITKSYLRQIIKEELLVILTDDEVEEMFGINISGD